MSLWDWLPSEIQEYIQQLADRSLHSERLAAVCAQITDELCPFPAAALYGCWRCEACGKRKLREPIGKYNA